MAKAKTKLTRNQQEWKKQERRIKRIVRDELKKGFVLEEGYNPIPDRPRRITQKRLQIIRAIKPADIRKHLVPKVSKVTLEYVREQLRNWDADIFFDGYTDYFKKIKTQDKKILENILEGAIKQEGEDAVALRLEEHDMEIIEIVNFVLYDSGGKHGREETQAKLVRFGEIIKGTGLSPEENKALTRYQEIMEANN